MENSVVLRSICTSFPITSISNGHYAALAPQHRSLTTHTHTHLLWEHVGVFLWRPVRFVKMLTGVPECSYRWYSICEKHISCAAMEVEFVLTHTQRVLLHQLHTPHSQWCGRYGNLVLWWPVNPQHESWEEWSKESVCERERAQEGKNNYRGNLYFVFIIHSWHFLNVSSPCSMRQISEK